MKANRFFIVVLITVLMVITACSGGNDNSTKTEKADTESATVSMTRVLLITEDTVGINPYFLTALEGLEKAKNDFDIVTQVVEGSGDPAQNDENLRAAVRENWDMIILMTFGFTDVLLEIAPDYPDILFVGIDLAVEIPNVLNVDFRTHEGAFLNGVAAGLLTKSNIVGQIGPIDIPFIHRWVDPFAVGAEYVNPEVTMLDAMWVGSFADPATAKELALTVSDKGADIINAVAAGGNAGIFEAAQEKDFLTFGVDINEGPNVPGRIIDNVIKRVDLAVYSSIENFISGKKEGGWTSHGLIDGGVNLAVFAWPDMDTQCVLADHPDVMAEVEKYRQMIISEEIVIPDPLFGGDYVLP